MASDQSEHTEESDVPQCVCKWCGKSFRSISGRNDHERRHSKTSPYSCCGKLFYSKANLTRHRCTAHGERKLFRCDMCGRSFALAADVRIHMKVHRPHEEKLTCSFCGMECTTKTQHRDHLAMHGGEKNYRCYCGKSFRHQPSLSRHRKKCQQKSH